MPKKKLTQEDLDKFPSLVSNGYKVGDEVELPLPETTNDEEDNEDDPGGGNHPKKPGNP